MKTWADARDRALKLVSEDGVKRVVVAYSQPDGGWNWYVLRYGSQAHLAARTCRELPPVAAGERQVSRKSLYVADVPPGPEVTAEALQDALSLLGSLFSSAVL